MTISLRLLNHVFESLGSLECRNLGSFDLDGFLCTRVDTCTSSSLLNGELTETVDINDSALFQCLRCFFEYIVDCFSSCLLCKTLLCCDLISENLLCQNLCFFCHKIFLISFSSKLTVIFYITCIKINPKNAKKPHFSAVFRTWYTNFSRFLTQEPPKSSINRGLRGSRSACLPHRRTP